MHRLRPAFGSDLAWGLGWSLSMAAILSAVVAIRDAAFSEMGAGRVGLDLASIIACSRSPECVLHRLPNAVRPIRGNPVLPEKREEYDTHIRFNALGLHDARVLAINLRSTGAELGHVLTLSLLVPTPSYEWAPGELSFLNCGAVLLDVDCGLLTRVADQILEVRAEMSVNRGSAISDGQSAQEALLDTHPEIEFTLTLDGPAGRVVCCARDFTYRVSP